MRETEPSVETAVADPNAIPPPPEPPTVEWMRRVQRLQPSSQALLPYTPILGDLYTRTKKSSRRADIVHLLGHAGQAGDEPLPLLIGALGDPGLWDAGDSWSGTWYQEVAEAAKAELRTLGSRGVPLLTEVLDDFEGCSETARLARESNALYSHMLARTNSARTLGLLSPYAESAIPVLLRWIGDPDRALRLAVAGAVNNLGQNDPWVLEQLVEQLSSKEARTRHGALAALAQRETLIKLLPKLADLIEDSDSEVQLLATNRLLSIAQLAAPVIPRVLKVLKGRAPQLQRNLLRIVEQSGVLNDEVLDVLVGLQRHPDRAIRGESAGVLMRFGPAAARVVPMLQELFETGDEMDRLRLERTLARIAGPQPA